MSVTDVSHRHHHTRYDSNCHHSVLSAVYAGRSAATGSGLRPKARNSRWVLPPRTATTRKAPAIGKKGDGPMWWMSRPATATDSGKVPNEHRMITLITR